MKCSPYKALFGCDPAYGILSAAPTDDEESDVLESDHAAKLLKEKEMFSALLQHHLARAQNHMKQLADAKRSLRTFQVGFGVIEVAAICTRFSGFSYISKVGFQIFWFF